MLLSFYLKLCVFFWTAPGIVLAMNEMCAGGCSVHLKSLVLCSRFHLQQWISGPTGLIWVVAPVTGTIQVPTMPTFSASAMFKEATLSVPTMKIILWVDEAAFFYFYYYYYCGNQASLNRVWGQKGAVVFSTWRESVKGASAHINSCSTRRSLLWGVTRRRGLRISTKRTSTLDKCCSLYVPGAL